MKHVFLMARMTRLAALRSVVLLSGVEFFGVADGVDRGAEPRRISPCARGGHGHRRCRNTWVVLKSATAIGCSLDSKV